MGLVNTLLVCQSPVEKFPAVMFADAKNIQINFFRVFNPVNQMAQGI